MVKVQKKDGSLQDFDGSKISGSLVRVGVSPEDAAKVANGVEAWAETAALDGVVKSSDIRAKVLGMISPEMAEEYKSFEATKR